MSQPNIILIITDQQRYDSINALGFPYMDSPNLDRLVNEGVSFDNCFITAPSCAPARASLFTGYYPHVTGIMRNADRWTRSWVEDLNEAGYHCVNIGKMHSQPFETPLGFHQRFVVENKDRYLEGRYYYDEWDKALAARGLVKQQREQYRLRDDYQECMGAFTWDLPADTHPDNFVGGLAQWWLRSFPQNAAALLADWFPRSAPALRSHARCRRRIHRPRPAFAAGDEGGPGRPAAAVSGLAQAQYRSRSRFDRAH